MCRDELRAMVEFMRELGMVRLSMDGVEIELGPEPEDEDEDEDTWQESE